MCPGRSTGRGAEPRLRSRAVVRARFRLVGRMTALGAALLLLVDLALAAVPAATDGQHHPWMELPQVPS
jgi:hypothetical protein